jgi:hypothetical protein
MKTAVILIIFIAAGICGANSQNSGLISNFELKFKKPEQLISQNNVRPPTPRPKMIAIISFTVSDFSDVNKLEILMGADEQDESFLTLKADILKKEESYYISYNHDILKIENNYIFFEIPVNESVQNSKKATRIKLYQNDELKDSFIK